MLEVVPSATLAALAGLTARGSDASATAAVLARERLRRLERGTTTSCQKVLFLPLCSISAAVSACLAVVDDVAHTKDITRAQHPTGRLAAVLAELALTLRSTEMTDA